MPQRSCLCLPAALLGASFSILFTGLHSLRPSFCPWNTPTSFLPQDLCTCCFPCLELSSLRSRGVWLLLRIQISAEKCLLGENSPSSSQVPLQPHPTSKTYSLITQCHFLYITIYPNLDVFSYLDVLSVSPQSQCEFPDGRALPSLLIQHLKICPTLCSTNICRINTSSFS